MDANKQTVAMQQEKSHVKLKPETNREHELDKLLSEITPESVHAQIDFCKSVRRYPSIE